MNIAESSLCEVDYYLTLSCDLGYGDSAKLSQSAAEIGRMLNVYSNAIRQSQ